MINQCNRMPLFGCTLIMFALSTATVFAATVGQVDDFEDSTTQQWSWGRTGSGGPEIVNGGPDGAADLFLQNESFGGGDGPGSRMAIFNRDQWTGDFIADGISAISLDAINLGPNFAYQDMNLRLAFFSGTALTGSGRVVTDSSFLLTRGSGWQHLVFDLSLDNLSPLAGSMVLEVMSSVSEMRIISAAQPAFIGDQFIARLGVDNITAVPEPGLVSFIVIGFVAGLSRRWRVGRLSDFV